MPVRRTGAICQGWLPALLLGLLLASRASAQDVWSQADRDTRRLSPSSFTALPAKVLEAIENRRCLIPQSFVEATPHNVVRGSFAHRGQTDWAVLCSRAHASTIFIVWGGPAGCPDEMEVREDRTYLMKDASGTIRYARRIDLANREFIIKMHHLYGGDAPPPLEHQGINDTFIGHGSTIRYCDRGSWLELTGQQE
jgi:hypothetical protein